MYTVYFIGLIFTCVLGGFLTYYAWQRRAQPAIRAFAFLTLATTFITFCFIGIGISPNERWAYFWARLRFIGLAATPIIYLHFALTYLDHPLQVKMRRYGWILYALAIVTNLFIWIAPDSFFTGWQVERHEFLYVEHTHYEGLGRLFVVYSYSLVIFGLVLFAREILRSYPPQLWQALILFSGTLLSLISNVPTAFNFLSPDTPTLTPIGFGVRNILFAWALFAFKLLDIVPIAYAAIFKSIPDSVIVLDTQNRVVNMNPAASRLLNKPLAQIMGQPAEIVFSAWPEFVKRYNPMLEAHEELVTNTGHFFDLKISPLYRQNNQLAGRLVFLHDITKRKQAELEREILIQTLNKYAHIVAHDLKNPLSVIVGFADLLQTSFQNPDPEAQMMLGKIMETSQSAAQIVDDLLLFASIRNKGEIPKDRVDMNGTLSVALRRLEQPIKTSGALIAIPQTLPAAIGYRAWVEEVWVNLLSNAVKYGGTPPMIQVIAEAQGEMICFQVRDNGKGLTPEEQHLLFQQFGRLEKHAVLPGHGLGLAIVQLIVERLGGQIGMKSEIGKGSTFYFILPGL